MLFSLGHGQRIVVGGEQSGRGGVETLASSGRSTGYVTLESAVGVAKGPIGRATEAVVETVGGEASVPGNPFGYLFPDAPGTPHGADVEAQLDALATAMVEQDASPGTADPNVDSSIPPVFTYLGQFIDHDITANTDRNREKSDVSAGKDMTPLDRDVVTSDIRNLRKGSLGLDSLYGDGPSRHPFAIKLEEAMRFHSGSLKGKMRLGRASAFGGRPPLPADPAADLVRLGQLIDTGAIAEDDVVALRDDASAGGLADVFLNESGHPQRARAIIGDARNDENTIVGQLQVAFLRLHNVVVDWLRGQGTNDHNLFEEAQRLTRWHYQWLVVNVFLPTICQKDVVKRAVDGGAPLYTDFIGRFPGSDHESMPLPLEFSVAAFRYGHSMARARYDFNRNFGRPNGEASFEALFFFTGGGQGTHGGLPENWIIEWDRFVRPVSDGPPPEDGKPARAARKIDTQIAAPLDQLPDGMDAILRRLALRNLRRSHRLNVPTAQGCIAAINAMDPYRNAIDPLTDAELTDGRTGAAATPLKDATPLWFYVLKEAEKRAGGESLGPLGSLLVADTLVGLVAHDPESYWHASGSDNGRWHPRDGAKPNGIALDELAGVFAASGLLDGAMA